MNPITIFDSVNETITFRSEEPWNNPSFEIEADGRRTALSILERRGADVVCAAGAVTSWTPENPVLHEVVISDDGEESRFRTGFRSFSVAGNRVLLNGVPRHFRGYIRGIVAHDHPNMTGEDDVAAARKNILQSQKYGFNLVRFHSTIPDETFVDAADELGLLVHMEIGFSYKFNEKGEKIDRFFDEEKWVATLKKFRHHPSVMIFCIGNEMHNAGKEPRTADFHRLAKEIAPGALMMDNTGWGEYDRQTTDLYAQHIAYFFPFKEHADMFKEDFCWKKNGSVADLDLEAQSTYVGGEIDVQRRLNPLRPVLAHETVHYIDVPDYQALNDKFDAFAAQVGEDYLRKHGVEKPRYLTELPAMIKAKGLEGKIPDYVKASRHFKEVCVKVYFEALRAAENLCGFEMLQLSDCLKYENKNGLIDFFDDDKGFAPDWFKTFNSDDVLLADLPERTFFSDQTIDVPLRISRFGPEPIMDATLEIRLEANGESERVYQGGGYHFPTPGVIPVANVAVAFDKFETTTRVRLEATLSHKDANGESRSLVNHWDLWCYPRPRFETIPTMRISRKNLETFINDNATGDVDPDVTFTDILDDATLADLDAGKTVILHYDGVKAASNEGEYYWPGSFERFKPCIWDRGHNLGGFIRPKWLRDELGGEFFDLNLFDALQGGYKVNLDDFPVRVNEIVSGIDKPVRDRMKGLIEKIKDFIPEQTLRNFSHLFSLKVDEGTLIVCAFNVSDPNKPLPATILNVLFANWQNMTPSEAAAISLDEFKNYLTSWTEKGPIREDAMNLFWEQDDRPVEDTLFWENAGIDLSRLR